MHTCSFINLPKVTAQRSRYIRAKVASFFKYLNSRPEKLEVKLTGN